MHGFTLYMNDNSQPTGFRQTSGQRYFKSLCDCKVGYTCIRMHTHSWKKCAKECVCVHLMETFAGTRLQRFQVSETWMWGQGENGLGWDTVSGKKTPYLRTRIWATRKYHRSKGGLYLYLNRYLNSAFIYLSNPSCLVCFVDFCFYFFTPPYKLDNGPLFNFTAFNIKLVTFPEKL